MRKSNDIKNILKKKRKFNKWISPNYDLSLLIMEVNIEISITVVGQESMKNTITCPKV